MKTSALIALLAVLIFAPRQVMAGSWGSYQHDPAQFSSGGSVGVSYNVARSDFYVRLDHFSEETTDLLAFHYGGNDAIDLLWTRSTAFSQLFGRVAVGENGNIYIVSGDELAIVDPNDGSTIQSVPIPFSNGATPALSRGVVWVDSEFQTLAFDAASLVFLRAIDGGTNLFSGWESPGAFVPGTAALNAVNSGVRELDVYREAAGGR
jgi:hypothetical protein